MIKTTTEHAPALGRVAALVAAHIEPVTRFDAQALTPDGSEDAIALPLTLMLQQFVTFEENRQNGPGRLSSSITKVGGASELNQQLANELSQAVENSAEALKTWITNGPDTYRRLLPGNAAFKLLPGNFGFEHTCTTCSGECQVTCSVCSGHGNTQCHACFGSGKVNCLSCGGTRKLSCSYCYGRGQWTEQVSKQNWNARTNTYETSYHTAYKSCSSCSGSGRTNCYTCDYGGKISCNGCAGQGYNQCAPCNATGHVDCSACEASGIQHQWGTVNADVQQNEHLEIYTTDATLKALVADRIKRAELPSFGALVSVHHDVLPQAVQSAYQLRVDAIRSPLLAQGRAFVIYGLGPESKVLDFVNIAGHLLEADLVELERCIAQTSRWRAPNGRALVIATQQFVSSELNLLIAEKVADEKTSTKDTSIVVEQHFKGLVGAPYIARATDALRRAFANLYSAQLLRPALYLCVFSMLVGGVLLGSGWLGNSVWRIVAWCFPLAALLWFALEWYTRRSIGREFETEIAARVLVQLYTSGSVKRWRWAMALGWSAVMLLGMWLTLQLPLVQLNQTRQYERLADENVLSNWSRQPQVDFQLRNYPSMSLLRERVSQGDKHAQLVLTWRLILGAGIPKDMKQTASLLDSAPTQNRNDPLWRSARAVYTLNQEVKPEELRIAMKELSQAASQGIIEATYWEAQIYMAEHSNTYNPAVGLQKLLHAAGRNHAHAALALGKVYSQGAKGIKRDIVKSKHYLEQARVLGLTESAELKKTLN